MKKEKIDLPSEVKIGKPEKKPKVTLVTYGMKMVIPTGAYANIQPEIVVSASTLEEAEAFLAPHMNKLWKEYYMVTERKTSVDVSPSPTGQTQTIKVSDANPVGAVAFQKATQAVNSCTSVEALALIEKQIDNSVKLTDVEKTQLTVLIVSKTDELNAENKITE